VEKFYYYKGDNIRGLQVGDDTYLSGLFICLWCSMLELS